MSDSLKSKWNVRHAWAARQGGWPKPASVVVDNEDLLPTLSGSYATDVLALDLACGRGGNALWLADKGWPVAAWDHSEVAITALEEQARSANLHVQTEVRDVIAEPPEARSFDVIVVSRFLHRPLCDHLVNALKPAGVLFYETFTHGLSTPEFMLQEDELLSLFDTLTVLRYRTQLPQGDRIAAWLVAQRNDQ